MADERHEMAERDRQTVIAGAGIAGLSAAYRLQGESDVPFTVFEKAPVVGGYSRTVQHEGFRFDLGGHRFYTKKPGVSRVVEELVGDDLLQVDRISRIFFNGRFVHYPLRAFSTLRALGAWGAGRAVLDYGLVKLKGLVGSSEPARTFEQWALPRFGRYLYEVYFRLYTEKTWGIPCTELSADFAEQRIKGLSFREAIKDAVLKKGADESLVRRFVYPRYGFGQITDAMAEVVEAPNRILTSHRVTAVEHAEGRIVAVRAELPDGATVRQPCGDFISSLAVDELVQALDPVPPADVVEAAAGLRFRSVVILVLFLDTAQVSPDHWIYVPSPEIGFCRLHEPRNWSPEMAPEGSTSLVLEYFCQENDETWNRQPVALAESAAADLEGIGLVRREQVRDFVTVRLRKAYPLYNLGYKENLDTVQEYLSRFENLHSVGRDAVFLYTSSDHYIDMGLKTAENILGHEHDLGTIGREPGYAES